MEAMSQTPDLRHPIELPIAGRAVAQVVLSRYVPHLQLVFFDGDIGGGRKSECTLALDGGFDLALGSDFRVDPAAPTPVVLELRSKTVERALADDDGTLRLSFTSGERLTVAPAEYEPWQFFSAVAPDDEGWLVVSVAGGGLAVWLPHTSDIAEH